MTVSNKVNLSFVLPITKETGAEIRPAIVCGIPTADAPVSYWSIFPLSLVTVPDVFAKVNSDQFPSVRVSKVAREG